MKIDVLGTKYTVTICSEEKEPKLENCDGFCDKTTKRIVVRLIDNKNSDLDNPEWYEKKVIRHEIIHAFLVESGLSENWKHEQWGQDETTVDWIAIQFPKLLKAFKEAGCIES